MNLVTLLDIALSSKRLALVIVVGFALWFLVDQPQAVRVIMWWGAQRVQPIADSITESFVSDFGAS